MFFLLFILAGEPTLPANPYRLELEVKDATVAWAHAQDAINNLRGIHINTDAQLHSRWLEGDFMVIVWRDLEKNPNKFYFDVRFSSPVKREKKLRSAMYSAALVRGWIMNGGRVDIKALYAALSHYEGYVKEPPEGCAKKIFKEADRSQGEAFETARKKALKKGYTQFRVIARGLSHKRAHFVEVEAYKCSQ